MTEKYDIIVCGGGFAGTAAAIAAARMGKNVLLVEKYNCLGGAAVFDLVNPFMRYMKYTGSGCTPLSAGIFTEIREKLEETGGFRNGYTIDEECLKIVLNRMCTDSGVKLLFGTNIISVKLEGRRIVSAEAFSMGKSYTLEADVFIDATGDANIAYMAGFPFRLGREPDNLCQPMTLCFRLGGVNMEKFSEERPSINPLYTEYQQKGLIRNPRENVLIFHTCHEGILHFNTTRVCGLDPTDPFDVTKAEIDAREQVFEMISFLKENFSAFRGAYLLSTGMQIGARESRMIKGLYTLTEKDLIDNTKFEDGIAACNYDIDIHSPDGSGTYIYRYPADNYYTVPYRCLVPENSANLLVAGRCISATHEAQSSFRIMPTCASIGEAAGVAASMCCDTGYAPGEIKISELRDILRAKGAVID